MMVTLPPDYRPADDEEFMNPIQVEYFRQKLLRWRADLLKEADGTLASLSEGGIHEADITDRASVETDRALELRTRDRARKLISKIDQALQRIENGSTATARKPTNRSASAVWRLGRSPPCRSRHRSGTSGWSACTATTEASPSGSRCAAGSATQYGHWRCPALAMMEGPMDGASLYDDDILAWSEVQAAALRSLAGRHDLPINSTSPTSSRRSRTWAKASFGPSRA